MGKPTSHQKQCIEEGFTPIQREVTNDFALAIRKAFPELKDSNVIISITTSQPQYGDYQCNNAMGLYKQHGKIFPDLKKPKDFGDKIAAALDSEHYDRIDVAPAGYVTVTLKISWLSSHVEKYVLEPQTIVCKVPNSVKVCVDFSSPNIAKEMHVGHLRSTIHGESLSRLLEFVGHEVERINHVGDWGTQFGMLIQYMTEIYPELNDLVSNQEASGESSFNPDIGDLNTFYKKAKVRFDADDEFKVRSRNEVVKLQSADPQSLAAWRLLIKISMNEFSKVYERLGIKNLMLKGESFYNDLIPQVVKLCEDAGQIEVVEGGAKCAFENPPEKRKNEIPLMLVKSDGGYGYDSTDAACIYYRLCIQHYKWIIYVTDSGQEEHFFKVFKLVDRMGWNENGACRLQHCGLGLVCGDDGKKFKTRSGEVVKLSDLLDEAVSRAKTELSERRGLSGEELDRNAAKIGYAAVKYFDMNQVRTGNYQFKYESMLDPKGNTAVYLFYTYARVCSIFRKCPDVDEASLKTLDVTEDGEKRLLRHLVKFPVVIEHVLEDMSMHKICGFGYDLCTIFSEFYRDCRIVDHEQKLPRLALCRSVKRILGIVFHLLGMDPVEQI